VRVALNLSTTGYMKKILHHTPGVSVALDLSTTGYMKKILHHTPGGSVAYEPIINDFY
jgi:hypothetical protein